ncbi:MAG: aldehyde dehydrogenase family protein, partial [Pseudomonadota bacterium]
MSEQYRMSIGGKSVATDDYQNILNPADLSEVVGQVPMGTEAHLNSAIAAAQTAYSSWRHSSDAERSEACQTIAEVATENAEELALLLTREQGKPLNGMGSRFEMGGCA